MVGLVLGIWNKLGKTENFPELEYQRYKWIFADVTAFLDYKSPSTLASEHPPAPGTICFSLCR